ncbi:MAG: mechanosensitive ion channel family protein [Myxococcota bacterium]
MDLSWQHFKQLMDDVLTKMEGWIDAAVLMAPNLAVAIIVVLIGVAVSLPVRLVFSRFLGRLLRSPQLAQLFTTIAVFAVRVTALFIALGVLNLDKTVTSLLAGVGVIGLALGFAFQDIAANFMAGIMMAFRRPFREQDHVELAGRAGRVERINLRSTQITTLDGLTVNIPNKDVFQSPITNYTHTEQRRMDVEVGVSYDANLETVRSVATEAVIDLDHRDSRRNPEVFFTGFGGSSIDLVVRVWLSRSDQRSWLGARSDAIIAIKQAFDNAGISIPFPIRTLDFGAESVGGSDFPSARILKEYSEQHAAH